MSTMSTDDDIPETFDLFSVFYSQSYDECKICIYQYLPEYKSQIMRFESMLKKEQSERGCGIKTCIQTVLASLQDTDEMTFMQQLPLQVLHKHFDNIFGEPICGYNNLKRFDFFSLFDSSNVDSKGYVDFIYHTYKHSRSTSLCPYALTAVYVYHMIEHSIEGISNFKRKHDFLWMYNALADHKIRLGKLQ